MIDYPAAIKILLERFPEFHETWGKHLVNWEGEERAIGIDLMPLTSFISRKLKANEKYDYQEVFDYIEYLMEAGDDEVQTAAATGFLEGLINISSHGDYPRERFDQYIGPKSREYCDAWDEFCGVPPFRPPQN